MIATCRIILVSPSNGSVGFVGIWYEQLSCNTQIVVCFLSLSFKHKKLSPLPLGLSYPIMITYTGNQLFFQFTIQVKFQRTYWFYTIFLTLFLLSCISSNFCITFLFLVYQRWCNETNCMISSTYYYGLKYTTTHSVSL